MNGWQLLPNHVESELPVSRLSPILNLGNFCTITTALAPGSGRYSMCSIQQDSKFLFGKAGTWQ
jgi:hypothetical protein